MSRRIVKHSKDYISWISIKKKAVRIYAEGDSWFDYLGSDVLTEVYDQAQKKPIILKRSVGGDEASQMLSGTQRHQLVKDFSSLKQFHHPQYNVEPDVILFSAGGNDLVGMYDFPMFVTKAPDGSPVDSFINHFHLSLRLQNIALSYIEMGLFRDRYFASVPIVTHQYDWAIPSNTGVEILGFEILKSWMRPYMDGIGIKFEDQKNIVTHILGLLSGMLAELQQGTFILKGNQAVKINNFHIAQTQGTLTPNEWVNEIHPTPGGFEKIGKVVLETIRASRQDLAQRL